MANIIKNLHLLTGVEQTVLDKMEMAGLMHKRHSNISFKVVDHSPTEMTMQILQERSANENHFTAKRLAEIVHETFDPLFPGVKIHARPIPYVKIPVDDVDAEWINKAMHKTKTRLKDISNETGIDYTQLSAIINDKRPLSQSMKAMFWFYFLSKKKKQ